MKKRAGEKSFARFYFDGRFVTNWPCSPNRVCAVGKRRGNARTLRFATSIFDGDAGFEPSVILLRRTHAHPPHIEKHFTASESIRDVVISMSDGLTVPFALAAGLSGAVDTTAIIVTAGLAEMAAGSIAMGLGGYLAAKSDAEHYASEQAREYAEIKDKVEAERMEVMKIFEEYGLTTQEATPVVAALIQRPAAYVDFMMRFELGLEKPDPKRALRSAITIALSYVAGGLIPLLPYFLSSSAKAALPLSVIFTLIALLIFGYVKGRFTGAKPIRSAIQTMLIGGIAAAAAFVIARLIS
jgi:VIT1/CCC1 family predicted Fe2+/Mn2+ transporter